MTTRRKRVAIQGIEGSFHDIAARRFFEEELDFVGCDTFIDVFGAVNGGEAEYGVVAIENSVAGSILPNYSLLRDNRAKIIGETYLRISQNLLALPGQSLAEIHEVRSHPMAIAQTRPYFMRNLPDAVLVESGDTASSARRIATQKTAGCGAVGSELAAELYGLEILARGIETNKRNYTRFLAVVREEMVETQDSSNKASLCFSLPHESGSLSGALSILSFYGIDLTKIQSLPIIGREWQYLFYVDVTYGDLLRYRQALSALKPLTKIFEVLGEYRKGEKSFEAVHHESAD
ncbi:MAG: prephenate dehydratase [Lentisphaeria bacterium]|nr:prephenate dehydratase [Lentisphaeria bacterium]